MQGQTTSAINAGTPDPVIPAVQGEFYRYSTEFTTARPLGFLMKCRANKGRSITDAPDHPSEHDLTFLFGDTVAVCSPVARPSLVLLGDLAMPDELHETRITRVDMPLEVFNSLRDDKNGQNLAQTCRAVITMGQSEDVVTIKQGDIIAVMTETGKFGLLRFTEVTPTSVSADACHILLP